MYAVDANPLARRMRRPSLVGAGRPMQAGGATAFPVASGPGATAQPQMQPQVYGQQPIAQVAPPPRPMMPSMLYKRRPRQAGY